MPTKSTAHANFSGVKGQPNERRIAAVAGTHDGDAGRISDPLCHCPIDGVDQIVVHLARPLALAWPVLMLSVCDCILSLSASASSASVPNSWALVRFSMAAASALLMLMPFWRSAWIFSIAAWGLVGWKLISTRPGKSAIRRLDMLARMYRGSICRIDIAFDVQPDVFSIYALHVKRGNA
jgi:hypothetical protein